MDWLVSAWTTYLEPFLRPYVDSVLLWRGLSLLLLTMLAIVAVFRKPVAEWVLGLSAREHDVVIFRKIDAAAGETDIDRVLNERLYNGWFTCGDMDDVLRRLIDLLTRIENQYLISKLRKSADGLRRDMTSLVGFTVGTFFSVGEDRVKFRPERIDRDVYDQEWKELQERIERAWASYQAYRMAVKARLKV